MGTLRNTLILLMLSALLAPAAARAQEIDWGPEEEPADSPSPVFGARPVDKLPADLRGQAVVTPVGRRDDRLRAVLYVPSHYDPCRPWPVLIEGVPRGRLGRSLGEFRPEAERHGFLLLAVEYLYHQGRETDRREAWSRDGSTTVRTYERDTEEFLADMLQDERTLKRLVLQMRRHYNVERRAVGITGFLGAGVMAYRMAISYPELICTAIGRSPGFSQSFLPPLTQRARRMPMFIIYGAKEEPITLNQSLKAIVYFHSRHFERVSAERIPHSGVDSRPEIAANYFRSIVDEVTGEERTAFDRAANIAGRMLEGTLSEDARTSDGKPVTGLGVARKLRTFIDDYPESDLLGQATLLEARLHAEQCDDPARARQLLRAFHEPPLSSDAAAPAALLYLAENLLDPKTDTQEVRRSLRRVVDRAPRNTDLGDRAGALLQAIDASP